MKYTKTNNTKANARLLKELGLYNAFKIERDKFILDGQRQPEDYEIISNCSSFADLLSESFGWANTSTPLLWEKLYYTIYHGIGRFTCTAEILKNEVLMNTLKNVVECYKLK